MAEVAIYKNSIPTRILALVIDDCAIELWSSKVAVYETLFHKYKEIKNGRKKTVMPKIILIIGFISIHLARFPEGSVSVASCIKNKDADTLIKNNVIGK